MARPCLKTLQVEVGIELGVVRGEECRFLHNVKCLRKLPYVLQVIVEWRAPNMRENRPPGRPRSSRHLIPTTVLSVRKPIICISADCASAIAPAVKELFLLASRARVGIQPQVRFKCEPGALRCFELPGLKPFSLSVEPPEFPGDYELPPSLASVCCNFDFASNVPLTMVVAIERLFASHGVSSQVACGKLHHSVWQFLGGKQMILAERLVCPWVCYVAEHLLALRRIKLGLVDRAAFLRTKFQHQPSSIVSRVQQAFGELHVEVAPVYETCRRYQWADYVFRASVVVYGTSEERMLQATSLMFTLRAAELDSRHVELHALRGHDVAEVFVIQVTSGMRRPVSMRQMADEMQVHLLERRLAAIVDEEEQQWWPQSHDALTLVGDRGAVSHFSNPCQQGSPSSLNAFRAPLVMKELPWGPPSPHFVPMVDLACVHPLSNADFAKMLREHILNGCVSQSIEGPEFRAAISWNRAVRTDGFLCEPELCVALMNFGCTNGGYLETEYADFILVKFWQGPDEYEAGGWAWGTLEKDPLQAGWVPQRVLADENSSIFSDLRKARDLST